MACSGKRLTSDREGLGSRSSVCLGALSEGGRLGAVGSIDLDLGISFDQERMARGGKAGQ
jgi:hypothetical protein